MSGATPSLVPQQACASMTRLIVTSLLAAATAVNGQADILDAVQAKCGDFLAPDNSYLNCNFNKTSNSYSCELSCRDGFLFTTSPNGENNGQLQDSFNIDCKDSLWQTSDNMEYLSSNYKCQRETLCRSTIGAECTETGAFESVQCDLDHNCWCVTPSGLEVPGTRREPGQDKPQCAGYDSAPTDSPALPEHYDWHDACVVWKKGEWHKTFDGQFFGYVAPLCQMTLMQTNAGLSVYQLPLDQIKDRQSDR